MASRELEQSRVALGGAPVKSSPRPPPDEQVQLLEQIFYDYLHIAEPAGQWWANVIANNRDVCEGFGRCRLMFGPTSPTAVPL